MLAYIDNTVIIYYVPYVVSRQMQQIHSTGTEECEHNTLHYYNLSYGSLMKPLEVKAVG